MIATVLFLTNRLIDFVKERFSRLENYDSLTIELIDTSLISNNSITESMIIFTNCDNPNLRAHNNPHGVNLNWDYNNNNNKLRDLSWQKRKVLRGRKENSIKRVLNAHRKMECSAEGSRVAFGGTGMSPRKTPISPRSILTSPESDCNSNNLNFTNELSTYIEKPQDYHDLFQDNSEYQWIMDFGSKDNTHHQSVFSVLRYQDHLYYDDIARDLDANLAEVDMDDFHSGDIHSVLSTLPNMCNSDIQGVEEREMFASVSESMMIKFGLDCSSPRSSSQEENSNSMSMCKSELLFSPIRESAVPNGNLSVDSLDLSENDINLLITCQANKNNYTIAFEGSTVMESDESVCHDLGDNGCSTCEETRALNSGKQCQTGKNNFASNINSMARSDSVYTTWSKIKQHSTEHLHLRRQPSGNNNPPPESINSDGVKDKSPTAVKSLSLPNLFRQRQKQNLRMSTSSKFSYESNSSNENEQQCIKLYDIQKSNNSNSCDNSTSSAGDDVHNRPHNLNLVKLFIKQKSASHEGMCNYVRDGALYSSYSEGNKRATHQSVDSASKKDCVCHLNSNRINRDVSVSKNCWTENNLNNVHQCVPSGFEDSLVSRNIKRSEGVMGKKNLDCESIGKITDGSKQMPESVGQISDICVENLEESNGDEVSSRKNNHVTEMTDVNACQFNVNNNNSVFDNQKNKYYSDESTQGNGSNTESAENIMCHCVKIRSVPKKINVMEKSIQTSKLLEKTKQAPVKEVKVPAYILYPNYSLPNLEFLKEKYYVENIDFTKIFLRPQTYKETEAANQAPKRRAKTHGKRPFSVNDIETLKKTGFKHVRDWDSLTFLLPKEYKEFLQEIPEITAQLKDMKNVKDDFKPLFCLNAPSRKMKKRPTSCDSNFFMTDCRSSNFSSTATQPSSGYRGSSTMLNSNNSIPTPSPRNPSSGFRYDSADSVYNSRKNTPPRSGSSLTSEGNDEPPTRPPLPRSILRNHSLDNTKYTCKTQKENANKRYSMIEFSEKNPETNDNKASRRKSSQEACNAKSPQKNVKPVDSKPANDSDERTKNNCEYGKKIEEDEICLSFKSSTLESDMRRLEELLEISAVFGESMESFTESDMCRLRSQVSKFLTMQKNLQKVSDCLQTVNENQISGPNKIDENEIYKEKRLSDVKPSHTPNNTPEHKKRTNSAFGDGYDDMYNLPCAKCCGEDCENHDYWHRYQRDGISFKEDGLRGLKKTVSFAEKISCLMKNKESKDSTPPNSPNSCSMQNTQKTYQGKSLKLVDVPISEESSEGSPADSPKKSMESNSFLINKKDLTLDVKNAVEKIIDRSHWIDDKTQEDLSNLCLHHLCPSLYAVLSDGLKEEIDTPFGPIRNSVWSVIEASSQQGPLTETLNHLVQRLNRDDILTEGLVKFNAFIFGLLNVNALDAWFTYLRTRDGLLHKHYNSRGLLLLSNSAGAPVRILMDQFIQIIRPLSEIKFGLDLMYQAKLLHCSLQNLNSLLEGKNNDLLSPTKQLMLLKLVQSIQNSISQPSEGKKNRLSSEQSDQGINDAQLTKVSNTNIPTRSQATNRARPRSGCEILKTDNANDVASCLKKRWSGVQLNSKLLQAFERLGEETESEYTDSLDNNKGYRDCHGSPLRTCSKGLTGSNDTIDEISYTWNENDPSENKTKEQRKNILSNLNKKNVNRSEATKTDSEEKKKSDITGSRTQSGGHKFKRLQQKWEKLSAKSSSDCPTGVNTPQDGLSPSHRLRRPTSKQISSDKPNSDAAVTLPSPTCRISRIPRPVSSPGQTTPTNDKQSGITRKTISPSASSNVVNVNEKSFGKSSNIGGQSTKNDSKPKLSTPNRISRVDELTQGGYDAGRGRAVRPSSLPYRGTSTGAAAKKNAPARASSVSLNRKTIKKAQSTPRIVRTLSHRLPSDSGHLSFNEGEKLRIVLEVDETWLLCCRGTQKGLVPKSAVIPVPEHYRY